MYEHFYYLDRKPFAVTPDPRFIFWSESHKEALAHLRYGIDERKGFVVITGEIGSGKTTLLQVLLGSIKQTVRGAIVNDPSMSPDDFFYFLSRSFGFSVEPFSKARFLIEFTEFLRKARASSQNVIIIIDEAHTLSSEMLEEIRLLSNLDSGNEKNLSIFLVGQPELKEKLMSPELLALKQRVGASYHLLPISGSDMGEYIKRRLNVAGAKYTDIFSTGAVRTLHRYTKGSPRAINILADQAMLTGYVKGRRHIDTVTIKEAARDLRLGGTSTRFLPAWLSWRVGAAAGLAAGVAGGLFYYLKHAW